MKVDRFYMKLSDISCIESINELIKSFLGSNTDIIWEKNIAKVIVLDNPGLLYTLGKITKIATNDFNIKIAFFVVPKFSIVFEKYLNQIDNDVYHALDVFINNYNSPTIVEDAKQLLKGIKSEFIETAYAYLQCNMNASYAAKELYLHRNSFDYRLSLFILNSEIDIKDFTNACFVRLLISLIKM